MPRWLLLFFDFDHPGRLKDRLVKTPRLPEQPIFYPVTNIEYARKIARDWNTKDATSGYEGHVLEFVVDVAFLTEFQPQTVGDSSHTEYWIPSERLEEFNDAIVGQIIVRESYSIQET